jgi:hypothetical protein
LKNVVEPVRDVRSLVGDWIRHHIFDPPQLAAVAAKPMGAPSEDAEYPNSPPESKGGVRVAAWIEALTGELECRSSDAGDLGRVNPGNALHAKNQSVISLNISIGAERPRDLEQVARIGLHDQGSVVGPRDGRPEIDLYLDEQRVRGGGAAKPNAARKANTGLRAFTCRLS